MTNRPTLLLMAGLPGAGKSTLAQALGRALGWPVIDKDTLVSTLLTGGVVESAAQPAAYALLFAIGRELLVEQRRSVILDSPAGDPTVVARAADLATDAGARLQMVLCLADQEVRNRRVAERVGKLSQPVGYSRTVGDGRERFPHLPPDTVLVGTDRPVAEAAREVLTALRIGSRRLTVS